MHCLRKWVLIGIDLMQLLRRQNGCMYCEGSLSFNTTSDQAVAMRTHELIPPFPMHAFARMLITTPPLPPGLRAHYKNAPQRRLRLWHSG